MTAPQRQVRRLRVAAADAGAARALLPRLEDALRCASLPDTGAQWLLVRRLALGPVAAGASSQELALRVEQQLRAVDVRWVDGAADDAVDAAHVRFGSALQAHEALALRVLRGQPCRAWYWARVAPGFVAEAPVAQNLAEIERAVVAGPAGAVAHAAWRAALARAGGVLHRVAPLRAAQPSAPSERTVSRPQRAPRDGDAGLAAQVAAEPRRDAAAGDDRAAAAAAATAAGRTPALGALSAPAAVRALAGVPEHAPADAPPADIAAAPAQGGTHPAIAAPALAHSTATAPAAAHSGQNPSGPALAGGSTAAPARAVVPPGQRTDRAPQRAPLPPTVPPAVPAAAAEVCHAAGPQARDAGDALSPQASTTPAHAIGRPTPHAGLMFLLPVLARLGLPEWAGQHGLDAPAWTAAVLRAALQRLDASPGDAWFELLAHTLPAPADACPAAWTSAALAPPRGRPQPTLAGAWAAAHTTPAQAALWLDATRRWLRRGPHIGLASLLRRPGCVSWSPTHVDVQLPLSGAELRVRRHGLDIDPGWLPWFGRVVSFHYGSDDR